MKVAKYHDICFHVFKASINAEVLMVAVGNVLISSIVLPTCYKYSMDAFVAKDTNSGFILVYFWLMVSIVDKLYQQYIYKPIKNSYDVETDVQTEIYVNNIYLKLDYRANRDIDTDRSIGQKFMRTRWNVTSIVTSFMNTIMSLCSLLGYVIWIVQISPLSLIGYIIAFSLLYFVKQDSIMTVDAKMDVYTDYWFYKEIFANKNLHGEGRETMEKINETSRKVETMRCKQSSYSDKLSMINGINFAIVMIINCYLFGFSMTLANVITYIQYCSSLNGSVSRCFVLYQQYDKGKQEHGELVEIASKFREHEEVLQIIPASSIVIDYLHFSYDSGFKIIIDKQMSIDAGDIVLLNGESGHGKSTFFDILGAYIHGDEYYGEYYVDGSKLPSFECLRDSRVYTEQRSLIFESKSVLDIIMDEIDATNPDMNAVNKALQISQCTFVNESNLRKKKCKFSGGEKGRIIIARTVYNLIKMKPRIVLLDEIDKAVQPQTMVKIMKSIFEYCKSHRMFTFVIAHSSEMHDKENYDKIYTFVKDVEKNESRLM